MNLITGVTGIVGAHVALALLQQDKPVVAVKRKTSDIGKTKKLFSYYTSDFENLFNKIKWVDADISDIYSIIDAMEGVDTVYHCAGFVSFDKKDAQKLYEINSIGTANMVNACLDKKIKALCYVSSIATLQNPDIQTNINEKVYWKSSPNASDYAISKYNGEREVWRGIEEGLNAVIVNPGIVLGPGFWNQSSGKLVSTCFKGTSFYTSGSSAVINANDLANCMVQLTEGGYFSNRYIIVEGNYTFKAILDGFHKKFNKKKPFIHAGKFTLRCAKWVDLIFTLVTGRTRTLNNAVISSITSTNSYDNSKIKNSINFKFTSFNETVSFISNAYLDDLSA
jgi:dihydroflavonol-4-reductase